MRSLVSAIGALAALGIGAVTVSACWPFDPLDDCERNPYLACFWTRLPSGAASSGGADGGPDPKCIPSENASPVANDCGVFVSASGDDSGAGTKEDPVQSLEKAIARAQADGKPVYACAENLAGGVEVPAGVTIYGGLDCKASWAYVGDTSKTTIVGAPDAITLRLLDGKETTHVEDVKVRAGDAMALGGSSIAVVAEGGTIELTRCEIESGMGRDGEKGMTPTDSVGPSDPDDPSIKGAVGAVACMGSGSGNPGGVGAVNATCNTSFGGDGGKGLESSSVKGGDGQPLPDPNPDGFGLGGAGEMASQCKPGGPGANGASGAEGAGATELGTIDATGYVGSASQDGSAGNPGQGGGGGGGAKGKTACNGASGGGGGAGGCGGRGGLGGKAGGSSIAVVSLNATLRFEEVVLRTRSGGAGGEGGDGQSGGVGGNGGNGGLGEMTLKACNGGAGGQGGSGGKGGGGRGGHTIGIAFKGTAPSTDGVTIETGAAGAGGIGGDVTGQGMSGVKAATQEFK